MATRFLPRWAVAGLLVIPAFGLGFGVSAAADSSTGTTFYACLKNGDLSNVRTASHSCSAGQTKVTWNASGRQGLPGPQGRAGPTVNTCSSPPGPGLNFSTCMLVGADWNWVDASGSLMNAINLTGSVMSNANMSKVNFSGANLLTSTATRTNFSRSAFPGAQLADSVMPNANFSYANLTNALAGSADFQFSNFTGANLTNAALGGANLDHANLTKANLSFSDLDGATTIGATVAGVTWNHTECPDGTSSSQFKPQTCVGHGF